MELVFEEILSSPSREEADQALLDCVLDTIRYSEPMSKLAKGLESIVRDASYWPTIRINAVKALMHLLPDNNPRLLKLAEDIRAGTFEDGDDEILGRLLSKLYPHIILPAEILDYLNPSKDRSVHFMFWDYEFPVVTPIDNLPLLIDQLVQRHAVLRKAPYEHRINRLTGELLVRGLESHGDTITDERLYDWLGVGLDEYENTRLEGKHAGRIASWFADHPSRYKAVIEHGASQCASQENVWYRMSRSTMKFHGSFPPADIGSWYLEKAITEQQSALSEYYFRHAVLALRRQGGQQELTLVAIEFLESVTSAYPSFQQLLEEYISCPIGDWQQEIALDGKTWKAERQKKKCERMSYFCQHHGDILNGKANLKVLHDLALVYSGLLPEAHGNTPDERLDDFLDGDKELIEATHAGFCHAIACDDLPTVREIVDLELKGKMHYLNLACLVGIDELFQNSPSSALQLNDAVLSRLLAFHFSYNVGDDPAWVAVLIQLRPELVAEVLLVYALAMLRAGRERVSGLSQLAYNKAYSEVALIALPQLLESFPLRARKPQLGSVLGPLLKLALHHLDRKAIESIVAHKLELGSMDAAQRVYWLACGLIISPTTYTAKTIQYIGNSKFRWGYLAAFLNDCGECGFTYAALPESSIALVIELLVPDFSHERSVGAHWVSLTMQTAELVRSLINSLGGNPSEVASRELERLLALPELAHWYYTLRDALHTQRIARRKALFHRLGAPQVAMIVRQTYQPVGKLNVL